MSESQVAPDGADEAALAAEFDAELEAEEVAEGFTQEDAEAYGWVFVHAQEPVVEVLAATQGQLQLSPGHYRAEKYVSLPGKSSKLVNEVAESKEQLLKQIDLYEQHLASVLVPEEPVDAAQALSRSAEDEKASQPAVATEQVEVSTADTIDSPGQSSGGTLVVHEGFFSVGDVSKSLDAKTVQEENDRVLAEAEAKIAQKALEEAAAAPDAPAES